MLTDLSRFSQAQAHGVYQQALSEMRNGKKVSHWMWFIFPQLKNLGFSPTARFYAIADLNEARSYVDHSLLGARLRETAQVLLALSSNDAYTLFGSTDALKLRSSMTLFAMAAPEEPLFKAVLDKFYAGIPCQTTIKMLKTA